MAAAERDQIQPRVSPQTAVAGKSLLGSLVIVARQHGISVSVPQLVQEHGIEPEQLTVSGLLGIASAHGLEGTRAHLTWSQLMKLSHQVPAIVILRNGHAMVVREIVSAPDLPRISVEDPNAHAEAQLVLDEARFVSAWTGEILLFKQILSSSHESQPFSFWLIVAQLMRDRGLAYSLGLSALMLSVLAIAPIMFWRLLVDRVLYYGSLGTLTALCVTLLALVVFETAFGYLRRYLALHLTQRIDAKLATYVFDKIILLPIDYFERLPIGETTRLLNEIHKIRGFLTNGVFGTLLDSFVLFVFVPIMLFFSPLLTSGVLGFAVLICVWIVFRLPDVRKKTGAAVQAEVDKGSFLIETLHGIRTIKALALDARRRREWDAKVAKAAQLQFEAGEAANIVQTVVVPLERFMVFGVFALAVYLSIDSRQEIYVGALFAFMMLSQRLASPIVGLAQMITQYDEAWFAIEIIRAAVNRPSEEGHSQGAIRPAIRGRVQFRDVRFRYLGTTTPALDDVSFTIPEGSIFGIMGRSGSGKTTVTRLLQLFHGNYEGLIAIDDVDLRGYDVDHLRRSFGVVSQENFLFSGTIRNAIASGKPDASFDEVVMAARLAGAEEFIERLPRGYDTFIYEGSSNLSGGQRQRLAIARALLRDAPVVLLDEPTSDLDPEAERVVVRALHSLMASRTVVMVSHRPALLELADRVLTVEDGRIVEPAAGDRALVGEPAPGFRT
ncbi:MAG: peptidase domain-containing ABC transporter, partial [Stellaceae bacterium]